MRKAFQNPGPGPDASVRLLHSFHSKPSPISTFGFHGVTDLIDAHFLCSMKLPRKLTVTQPVSVKGCVTQPVSVEGCEVAWQLPSCPRGRENTCMVPPVEDKKNKEEMDTALGSGTWEALS